MSVEFLTLRRRTTGVTLYRSIGYHMASEFNIPPKHPRLLLTYDLPEKNNDHRWLKSQLREQGWLLISRSVWAYPNISDIDDTTRAGDRVRSLFRILREQGNEPHHAYFFRVCEGRLVVLPVEVSD